MRSFAYHRISENPVRHFLAATNSLVEDFRKRRGMYVQIRSYFMRLFAYHRISENPVRHLMAATNTLVEDFRKRRGMYVQI